MGRTFAIHWAATTHGTWLQGDPRGSWRHGRLIGPDRYLEAECRARMSSDAVVLNRHERSIVAEAFGSVVCERRHRVFAATVQATHVHLVFAPLQENVDAVIARLKRRGSIAVFAARREVERAGRPAETAGPFFNPAETAGLYSRAVPARRKSLWTAGKFVVFIFNDRHLANAIEYVRDHNRRGGLPADPFDWIEPLYVAGEIAGERVGRGTVCEEVPF